MLRYALGGRVRREVVAYVRKRKLGLVARNARNSFDTVGATHLSRKRCATPAQLRQLANALYGKLYDMTGSYTIVWWLSVALSAFAVVMNLPVRETAITRTA